MTQKLDQQSIRRGHRELLSTFREFVQPIACADDAMAADDLRGAVAFLRHGIVGFARREEECHTAVDGCGEDVSREHAFIAAEIEQIAHEVNALMARPADTEAERKARLARIRRHAFRIEAALEVHLLRDEEPDLELAELIAPASGHPANEMSMVEASDFLRSHAWGVLSTIGAGRPYAVPVAYAFDGQHLYVATGPGRKAENLDACPAVCVTVPDVIDGNHWQSVVVIGDAHPVDDLLARVRALRLLGREREGRVTAKDLARAARARVLRISATEISGRRQGMKEEA